MKKFIADPSFWVLFPDAAIGVLTVKDMDEAAKLTAEQAAEVADILKNANAAALRHLDSSLPLSQNRSVAVWREAYQKFPTKKGARCSIEALLKRVSKGEPVGTIAPTVDLTNAISLRYALPIGVENMAAFQGNLHLGTMSGGEDFLPIGSEEQDPPRPGEVAYYDEKGVVPDRLCELQAALDELADLLKKYAGAAVIAKQIVTAAAPEMVIAP